MPLPKGCLFSYSTYNRRISLDPTTRDTSSPIQRFRSVFANRHAVLPVIHVESAPQALRNAQIAREASADGVFLINHGMSWEVLLSIHQEVTRAFPSWWVGVNCLDLSPEEVFGRLSPEVDGVWVDNAQIREDHQTQTEAEAVSLARSASGWPGLYFGGVAFKYQRQVSDLAAAATLAAKFMDVVTTSGAGTGQAANVEKIKTMKEALGETPLAIASGITPENVSLYLPFADALLVATGISRSFEELEPAKVQDLIQRVRAYSPVSR